MKSGKTLLLILLATGLSSCQLFSDHSNKLNDLLTLGAASASISQTSGGTITSPSMTLTVPQGALEEDTVITYREASIPHARESTIPLQAAYEFGPEGLQFNKPASLKICYDAADVRARGLKEQTLQIQYRDPETDELISMGGDVDLTHHCVTASVYHFSAYVLTAQLLAVGNNAPTIGGATFFPARPIEGLPVTVRSSITDWDAGSAVAMVRFFYRQAGSGSAFKSLAMLPEANDASGQFYTAKVPATDVTAAGLEYYIEAFDSLNSGRTNPATAPSTFSTIVGDMQDASTPIRFQTPVTQMSAGFSRDLTVQVKGASAATYYPVPAETLTFAGSKGETSRPTWLSARYTAKTIGASFLQATYGSLTVSQPIHVYPGLLNRIDLRYNDAVLPTLFEVDGLSVTQIDAAGYDAYGNFMFVQPVFSASSGLGTFGGIADYGKFFAADVFPDTQGTITATLGNYSVSNDVLVHHIRTFCQYNVGRFDTGNSCVYQ